MIYSIIKVFTESMTINNTKKSVSKTLTSKGVYMRVLILSSKTGGGHMRAAQALEAVIKERDSEAVVKIVDGLEYVNHYLNKMVVDGYKFSAMKFPRVYGVLYRASNTDNNIYKLVQKTNSHYAKKFIPLLAEFKPDVMVSTHPFMSIMGSRLREKGITNIPASASISFQAFKWWTSLKSSVLTEILSTLWEFRFSPFSLRKTSKKPNTFPNSALTPISKPFLLWQEVSVLPIFSKFTRTSTRLSLTSRLSLSQARTKNSSMRLTLFFPATRI